MEISDILRKEEIMAFEHFCNTVERAKKRTINYYIEKFTKELDRNYFFIESGQKRKIFKESLKVIKDELNIESEVLLKEWYNEYIL